MFPVRYRYPCMGYVSTKGFARYLEQELFGCRRNLQLFEADLRRLFRAPLVSLVNSGSSAHLAAARLVRRRRPGKNRVLFSAFSFPTAVAAFSSAGFQVELVDTERDGFNLCPSALADRLDHRVAAVVATHFLGFPADLQTIAQAMEPHDAMLVQDACETMNLETQGRPIHRYGDLIAHSFYHPHHLSAYGGGALVARSARDHDEVESIIHWGRACRCHYAPRRCRAPSGLNHHFWYVRPGLNVELSELNACFGRFQLRSWKAQEARRQRHYRILWEALRELPGVRVYPAQANLSPFVFPVSVEARRLGQWVRALAAEGIEARNLMGGPIHRNPGFGHLAHRRLKHSEALGDRSFFIGIHQTLETRRVREAGRLVRNISRQVNRC